MTEDGNIFLFRSTHDAIAAEQALIGKGLSPRVIPVPKEISPDCGIALSVVDEELETAKDELGRLGIGFTIAARRKGE